MGWTCSTCGSVHEDELRDIRAGLPDAVFELSEAEREERAEVGDDWCRFLDAAGEERYYVRGVLHLPIAETNEDFRFGGWIEVDESDFSRLTELWHDENGAATRPFFGRLANELNRYPG
ncbi:MAG: DUF2199 domain-containing protein, partial [Actinomycetota bacterium]|nr:DUF2199 domain-containing protein [Actinomycetota bacterium]